MLMQALPRHHNQTTSLYYTNIYKGKDLSCLPYRHRCEDMDANVDIWQHLIKSVGNIG
jgi:hypothetical protein